jgi:rhodanese-related sulfurtransferase
LLIAARLAASDAFVFVDVRQPKEFAAPRAICQVPSMRR